MLHWWPGAVFSSPFTFSGTIMIPPLECRVRASECEHMAQQAPRAQVRDILLDMDVDVDAAGTGRRAVDPSEPTFDTARESRS